MENQHFWHKTPDFTLFHDFSASQLSWSARNEQNTTLQLRQNSGEADLVPQKHQNMPQIGCFGAFSLFLRSIPLGLCTQNLLFYSSNLGCNIPNDRNMPQEKIKWIFQIWPKAKLSSLQSTVLQSLFPRNGVEKGLGAEDKQCLTWWDRLEQSCHAKGWRNGRQYFN